MSKKGTIVAGLGLVCILAGVVVLATGTAAKWVPTMFAALWGVTIGMAIDYFRGGRK